MAKSPLSFEFTGMAALERQLSRASDEIREAGAAAIREEAEIELEEAKRRTPVRFGALRASGHVTQRDDDLRATISFGGPSAPYAVYVHENTDAFHRVGQAKFLESVIRESAPHFAARVARRIRAAVPSFRRRRR